MTDSWATPKRLKEIFDRGNYFDPCPLDSHVNALEMKWKAPSFINPPFSILKEFVDYGLTQPKPQIWLVPATPDRKWFQKLMLQKHAEILYFHHRIFIGSNFPSALIILRDD